MSHRSFYSSFVTTHSMNVNCNYDKNLKHALSASFWCNQVPKSKKTCYADKFEEITQPQTEPLHEITTFNENEYSLLVVNILYNYIKLINTEWEQRMKLFISKMNKEKEVYNKRIEFLMKENYNIKFKYKKVIEEIKKFHLERKEYDNKQIKIIGQVIKENEYLRKCIYNTNNICNVDNNNNFELQLSYRKNDKTLSCNGNRNDNMKELLEVDLGLNEQNNRRDSIQCLNEENVIRFSK